MLQAVYFALDKMEHNGTLRRYEFIVLPKTDSTPCFGFMRRRTSMNHHPTWRFSGQTAIISQIKQARDVYNYKLLRPILVTVSERDVIETHSSQKTPYYVINFVKRVLTNSGIAQ